MPVEEQGLGASRHRYQLVPRVLCFVLDGESVLLLRGAPDKPIWPGRYNGLGGHVERGETVHAAAAREIREEAGLEVSGLRLRGVVVIDTGEPMGIGLFVFSARSATRATQASDEGGLEWVPLARIGEYDCVEDVPVLLARIAGMTDNSPPFCAHYAYEVGGKLLIHFDNASGA